MLTDAACRKALPREKRWKLFDGQGLYLEILPSGSRSWRWKYRYGKKEKRLTFGPYPEIGLTDAREMRLEAARQLLKGRDPGLEKRKAGAARHASAETTFRTIAEQWLAVQMPLWSAKYARMVRASFDRDILPKIGDLPIAELTAPLVLDAIRPIEKRGAVETARRTRQKIEEVCAVAIALGAMALNPAAGLEKAVAKPKRGKSPAVRTVAQAQAVLKTVEARPQHPLTRIASRLLALTALRSAVVRLAERDEFEDLDGPVPIWRVPAAKMKLTAVNKEDAAMEFIVPLAHQSVALVKLAMTITPRAQLLFPSMRSWRRPMSDSTISKAYREAGWSGIHVPHGWRSTFSTVMNELAVEEERAADRAIIDLMLAHVPTGVEPTYNRAAYMPRRRAIAQQWADLLCEGLLPPAALLEGPRKY